MCMNNPANFKGAKISLLFGYVYGTLRRLNDNGVEITFARAPEERGSSRVIGLLYATQSFGTILKLQIVPRKCFAGFSASSGKLKIGHKAKAPW